MAIYFHFTLAGECVKALRATLQCIQWNNSQATGLQEVT